MASPLHQPFEWEDPLLDKGKPAARRGRKVTGQTPSLTAGLPKEGVLVTPGNMVVSPQGGDHDAPEESAACGHSRRARPSPERSPPADILGNSRDPRRLMDRAHHEY